MFKTKNFQSWHVTTDNTQQQHEQIICTKDTTKTEKRAILHNGQNISTTYDFIFSY